MNSGLSVVKNPAEKQPEVVRELGYLEKACTQLYEAIENVETRFVTVLAHIPGNPNCEPEGKQVYACELAEYIATQRKRVEDAVRHLSEIRERCEL